MSNYLVFPQQGVSTGGNTAGTTSVAGWQQLVFEGGANITLSEQTAASGATIVISGGAGGGGMSTHDSAFHSGNIIPAAVQDFGNFAYSLGTAAVPAASAGRLGFYGFGEVGNTRFGMVTPDGTVVTHAQDTFIIAQCNIGSGSVTKGQLVYVDGANGTRATFKLAKADSDTTLPCVGFVAEASIANGSSGRIQLSGMLLGVDTNGLGNGSDLFVSATTAGAYVTSSPVYPNFRQRVGTVVNANPSGSILITIRTQLGARDINAISAGTTNATSGQIIFSNSNGVSFGLNGATLTGSHNALTSQSNQNVTAANGGFAFQTLSFSNANNFSFGTSAGSAITGSYTVPTVTNSSWTVSDAATSGTVGRLAFTNLNGVTLSLSTGAAGSHTIVGSHNAITSQSNQQMTLFATGNTTQSSTGTTNASSIIFNGAGIASVGITGGSVVISVPAGAPSPVNFSAGTTSGNLGSVVFSDSNGVSFGLNGSTITASASGAAAQTLSYFMPEAWGATSTQSIPNGTVHFMPFFPGNNLTMYRAQIIQQITTQATTTQSFSASVSSQTSTSGSGGYGLSGTLMLFSRVSTGTAANSSQLISYFSDSYSLSIGMSASVSWSTNASSASVSVTTSGRIQFNSSFNSAGMTTGSFGSTSSTTFSSTSTNQNSFSSSFGMTFGSQVMSQVRPLIIPFRTSISPGEWWLAHIQSSSSGSGTYSLQRLVNFANPGIVFYTTNTTGYAEIGSTATIVSSNLMQGMGSYSASSQTSTTIPISQISNQSQFRTWFNLMAWNK